MSNPTVGINGFGRIERLDADARHIISSLMAGAIAGSLSKTTIAPLERTKINFQVSKTKRYSYKAAVKFLKLTYQRNGFFALFRGNSATMAHVIPYTSILFCTHEQYKNLLQVDKNGMRTPVRRYIAGSLAALTATCLTYPLDTAKTCLSVSSRAQYPTLTSVFVNTYREQGLKALYRGMWPSMVGVVPYAGFSFFTYESLKLMYEEEMGHSVTPLWSLCFGAFAGLIGHSSSYPLGIVRRRMQTGRIPSNRGILATLYSILMEEGLARGLYKGLSMNWITGPIAAGVSFTTYDYTFAFIKRTTD